jgi:type IV secretory pathway VirD2 relaxase
MSDRDPSYVEDLLRPRFGRSAAWDREPAPSFHALLARGLQKYGAGRSGRYKPRPSRPGRVAVREPNANSRRCVIKARYVPLRTQHGLRAAKDHLKYLERDGVERDGSPGRFYAADENFIAEEIRTPLKGEQRQFRFIVSPEDTEGLDLTEFTRRLMSQVERDLGRRLIWAAVNHHNTDNPHVHIVIRGVDRDGSDLRIDGGYIGRGMRWRAQETLTRELGPRLEFEFSRTKTADIERERFTEIDRTLDEHLGPNRTVVLRELLELGPEGRNCAARLQTLRQLNLARETAPGTWELADGWKESLADLGEYHDKIERLYPLVGQKAIAYQTLDPNIPVPAFEGVVVGKGLDDELTGQMFAAVQTSSGASYYVRLRPEVAEPLRQGQTVRMAIEVEPWLKPADRIIARFAQEHGGTYDPPRHQRALETLARPSRDGREPSPADRVAANIRRLERLARYRLAKQLPDGRWQVVPNLVRELEARERTHPRHSLRLEPVRVPPREPARERVPDPAIERADFGRIQAEQLGLTFVSEPSTFRGRAFMCEPAPSGREFVRVVDEPQRQFTLIPKPPDIERLLGRRVVVSRDREQALSIQLGPEISR